MQDSVRSTRATVKWGATSALRLRRRTSAFIAVLLVTACFAPAGGKSPAVPGVTLAPTGSSNTLTVDSLTIGKGSVITFENGARIDTVSSCQ